MDLLKDQVKHHKLNLIVIADWFDLDNFLSICKNTPSHTSCSAAQKKSKPEQLDAQPPNLKNHPNPKEKNKKQNYKIKKQSPLIPNNIYSINLLLESFSMQLAYQTISAKFSFDSTNSMQIFSGTFLSKIPRGMWTLPVNAQIDTPSTDNKFFSIRSRKYPILGLYSSDFQEESSGEGSLFVNDDSGKVMVFGDSSCFETKIKGNCLNVLDLFVTFLRK
jgi:hypothetical protein